MRTIRRPDDMPLYGKVLRVRKGKYEVIIKFVASQRVLHREQILLPSAKAVKAFYQREYPTMTWGKPKYGKGKKNERRRKSNPSAALQAAQVG